MDDENSIYDHYYYIYMMYYSVQDELISRNIQEELGWFYDEMRVEHWYHEVL